ncbi:MAG: hypothetical protein KAT71_04315 [Gammaproteobacteria bacterium]|nr:hypothetical protein [Gammaproteobacteria bacterium]
MEKEIVTIFFLLGLVLNSAILIPQIVKVVKTKDSQGLSGVTFLGFCVLQFIVVLHAYFHHDVILMVGMFVAMFTTGLLVFLIMIYKP